MNSAGLTSGAGRTATFGMWGCALTKLSCHGILVCCVTGRGVCVSSGCSANTAARFEYNMLYASRRTVHGMFWRRTAASSNAWNAFVCSDESKVVCLRTNCNKGNNKARCSSHQTKPGWRPPVPRVAVCVGVAWARAGIGAGSAWRGASNARTLL